jgi:hypothetical protein
VAERVEVIRVPVGARAVEIARMSAERHTIGTYKASEIGSWGVGITAREHRLARIEKAASWNKEIQVKFEEWCRSRGLTVNPGIAGLYRKIARVAVRLGMKHADILLDAVPQAYRGFWDELKEVLITGYANVRG